jgi:hypothetical protein
MLVSQYDHTLAIRLNATEIQTLTGESKLQTDFYVKISGGFKRGLEIKAISFDEYNSKINQPGFRRDSPDGYFKPYIQNNNFNARRVSLQYGKFELDGLSISRGIEVEPISGNKVLTFSRESLAILWGQAPKATVVPPPTVVTPTAQPRIRPFHVAPSHAQTLEEYRLSKVVTSPQTEAQDILNKLSREMGLADSLATDESTDSKPVGDISHIPAPPPASKFVDVAPPPPPPTPAIVVEEVVETPVAAVVPTPIVRRKIVANESDDKGLTEFKNNALSLNEVLAQTEGLFIRLNEEGKLVLELEVELYEEF